MSFHCSDSKLAPPDVDTAKALSCPANSAPLSRSIAITSRSCLPSVLGCIATLHSPPQTSPPLPTTAPSCQCRPSLSEKIVCEPLCEKFHGSCTVTSLQPPRLEHCMWSQHWTRRPA